MTRKTGLVYYVWYRRGSSIVWSHRRFSTKVAAILFEHGMKCMAYDTQIKESGDYYA